MSSPPAGWYPDPAPGSDLERWWDGGGWAERTRARPAPVGPPRWGPPTGGPSSSASGAWGAAPGSTSPWGAAPGPTSPWGAAPGFPPARGTVPHPLDARTGTTSDERSWAVGAHLSGLVAATVALSFLGPLVVYLVKRDESAFVRAHAAAALNFHLSWLLWSVVGGALAVVVTFVTFGLGLLLVLPLLLVVLVVVLVLVIVASVRAGRGEAASYPLSIPFVR